MLQRVTTWLKDQNKKPTDGFLGGLGAIFGSVALWVSCYSLALEVTTMNVIGFIVSWASLLSLLYLLARWTESQTESKATTRVLVGWSVALYSVVIALAAIFAVSVFN